MVPVPATIPSSAAPLSSSPCLSLVTSPPPCPPPPSLSHSVRAHTAEKREKEWSDEDGGSDKGSGKETEEKGATPHGSSGDDDYQQVKSKRQKLKEKKKKQKAKKAEAAMRSSPVLLPDEFERERLWILDSLKPSPEAIDQAIAGHPAAHPLLLRMLLSAESLISLCTDTDSAPPPAAVTLFRRLVLSPSPLTSEAFHAAFNPHSHTL
jgi:hypothetical protein